MEFSRGKQASKSVVWASCFLCHPCASISRHVQAYWFWGLRDRHLAKMYTSRKDSYAINRLFDPLQNVSPHLSTSSFCFTVLSISIPKTGHDLVLTTSCVHFLLRNSSTDRTMNSGPWLREIERREVSLPRDLVERGGLRRVCLETGAGCLRPQSARKNGRPKFSTNLQKSRDPAT